MSGDVQPRKRRDKKRKKDDSAEHIPSHSQTPPRSSQNEDINIHLHKEDGTGGGICAKIIFFILFSALAVLIGLIITEHRGLTDLDTVDQESRFSQLFEGWIDNSVGHDEHDDDDHIVSSLEEEDHEDEDEGHEEEEEEEHDDEHEEEPEEPSEEVAETEEEDEEEVEASEEAPQTEEEEEEEEEQEETAEDDEEEEPNVSPIDDEDDVSEVKDEEDVEEAASEEPADEEEAEPSEEADEQEASEETVAEQSEEKASEEAEEVKEEEEEEVSKEDKGEAEEEKAEDEQEDEDQQNSKMVVKIGVGVALLVVAHVVLVRKWKSATPEPPEKEATPDLSRRNTIVVPPAYQEIEHEIEDGTEEYSDEDGEVESEEERPEANASVKQRYQELRTTYTRSLTPESELEYQSKDDEEYEEEEEEEEVEDEEEEEEEEGEESDGGEYDKEEDDDDLLKRLEARYGKLGGIKVGEDNEPEEEESESDKQSDAETYEYENITNKDDLRIKEQIDEAHKNIQDNTAYAIKLFDALLQKYPSSPRSLYGKAKALDVLADKKRSNDLLQKAIATYSQILSLGNVPNALFEAIAERCINRMRFMGNYMNAINIHQKLISRFPGVIKYKNELVVSYLTINSVNKARLLLQEILAKDPKDGFALVHYGFILKTVDNKLNESVTYLQKGLATKAPGVIDGRFYFHLGDALARLGRTEEAMKVYEDGVKHNLFLSKYQRSLYNIARLKSQPWWKKQETPYSDLYTALEKNWEKIRDEGIAVLNKDGLFQRETENLKDRGDWKQFELFARGRKNVNNCKKCPLTCKIIESVPDASGCKRGQTKFSVMHPGTHVWPHCGPTNCRLRVHLGLKVPSHTYIRVAEETRSWKEGEIFIFDDSFEHEVWHNGTSLRLVLIVDVWHPEVSPAEKRSLSPI